MLLENINLTGQFLIAMPSMTDPYFSKTITYICTHNQDGAMGVVINRPIELNVASLFKQMKLEIEFSPFLENPLYFGGPVQQERGFILHTPHVEYNSTLIINNSIALTTSKDILEAVAQHNAPEKMLIALGYAGWTAGQLEEEIGRNAWLNLETQQTNVLHALIFDTPNDNKFDLALRMMGLNLANLSDIAGHAQMLSQSHLPILERNYPDISGTIMAFDFGEKRIGVATGETMLKTAHALTTIESESNDMRFAEIGKLIEEWKPNLLVVGLPVHMDGKQHQITHLSKKFAQRLEGRFDLPVIMIDERLSSAEATQQLSHAGVPIKLQKNMIDAVAAQVILQSYFDNSPQK